MKVKSILNLSVKNIFLKKSAYLKVLAGFFFAFLIIFIVLFYSGSLSIAYKDYEDVNADDLIYEIYGNLTEEQEKDIRAFPQVKSIYSYSYDNLVYDSETVFTIGGTDYVIGKEELMFDGIGVGQNSDAFCENKALAFRAETGEEVILFGETPKKERDILVSEKILNFLNIEELIGLLGKEITINGFEYGDWSEDGERLQVPYSLSGTICGIINGNFTGDFIFTDNETPATKTEISLNTFTGNEDFFAAMDEMFGEETSHYFNGQSKLSDMKIVEGQEMLCNRFLSIICVTLLAVICVYVASNQYYLLQKNSVFYGILKANGVSNGEVFLMHMFELAIVLFVALIIAFGVSVGVFFIMQTLFDSFLSIELLFPAGIAAGAFFGFLALSVLLALCITAFVYNKILKKPPVGLLRK